jgi:excinuclease ABC subunit B
VVDDPTAKQRIVQGKAGAYAGARKYGAAANLPTGSLKKRGGLSRGGSSPSGGVSSPSRGESQDERSSLSGSPAGAGSREGVSSSPSPLAGSEASEARSRGRGGGSTNSARSKVHKPHLDEMHGPESLPHRPGRDTARKPSRDDDKGTSSGSKIFQPTDSRQSGPEFGPAPRSTGGAPGHRGGWKKR